MPLFEFSDRREQFESSPLSGHIVFEAQDEFHRPSAWARGGLRVLFGAGGEDLLLLLPGKWERPIRQGLKVQGLTSAPEDDVARALRVDLCDHAQGRAEG